MIRRNGFTIIVVCMAFVTGAPLSAFAQWDFSQAKSLPYQTTTKTLFENVKINGVPHMVIMQSFRGRMVPIQKNELNTVQIPFRTITIDGDSSDWSGISPVVEDPVGDEEQEYSGVSGTDLASVYMARDDTYLYLRMTFHDGDPIISIYVVELQQYLNQLHTPGDRICIAANDGNGWSVSVVDRIGVGLASYPGDHVGIGPLMVEWKVPISDMQFAENTPCPYYSPVPVVPGIQNTFIRAYIHPLPHPRPVADSNDQFTRPMIINFY